MSMREPEFQQKVALTALQRKFYKTAAHPVPPAAVNAELTAISTALASDPSLHDQTIETPPAALRIGPSQTGFTNDILHLVNKAKGGNLTKAAMISAIDGVAGVLAPPGVVDVPQVMGRRPAWIGPALHQRQLGRHADRLRLPVEARRDQRRDQFGELHDAGWRRRLRRRVHRHRDQRHRLDARPTQQPDRRDVAG